MPTSKPFVIATEGPTVDGRNISREWLTQMAESYDPKVYTAVANLEHYLSSVPDSVFGAYGKVISLSTQEATIMGEKKLQLLAVVDANDALVSMQQAGKKAFSSMEVLANFLNKGIAYLSGLAFTDTPASIGTESMKFSMAGAPGERFAFSQEVAIEFENAKPEEKTGESLFSKVLSLLSKKDKNDESRFSDIGQAVEAVAGSQKDVLEQFATLQADLKKANEAVTKLSAESEQDRKAFSDLKASLESQESGTKRPAASGGNGSVKTDC